MAAITPTPTCSICTSKGHYDLDCSEKPKTATELLQHFVSHPFMADLPEGDMLRLSQALKDAYVELAKPGKKVLQREIWTPEIALVVDDTHYQINRYERVSYLGGAHTEWIVDGFRCVGDIMTAPKHPIHFNNQVLGDYIKKILLTHGQPNRVIISSRHISPNIMTYTEMIKKWADRDELEITCRNEYLKNTEEEGSEEHEDSHWRGDYTYGRFIRHIQDSLLPH